MAILQAIIHRLEVGGGLRYFKYLLGGLALATVLVLYDTRCWKNLSAPEAMDAAQLARNIATGKGYSTLFIRPLSMAIIRQHRERNQAAALTPLEDPYLLKTRHPDLANPPVYPIFLAGLMKVLPFQYRIPEGPKAFWNISGVFWRYQPDFLITLANQVLLLATVAAVFFLALRLFGSMTATVTAILLVLNDLLWRFSISGLSTVLLLLIFTGILWCLVLLDESPAEGGPPPQKWRPFALAAALGLLCGLGGLTRYAFLWTLPALAAYLLRYGGSRRFLLPIITVACALLVVAPWLARNYSICGTAFGTAGFSLSEGTTAYPEYQLQRSLAPDAGNLSAKPLAQKLLNNFRHQLSTDLPRFAGGWIGAFFLVSILIPFRFEAVPRIKFFILITFGLYFIAQALGRTQLAEETPETNSENLFILLAPIATAYGVSIFFLFLDQLEIPTRELRLAAIILFVAVCSLPMILNMLPPRPTPWAYPPYHPPSMQAASRWSRPDDLVMSDLPWATAWYGRSQCVWLTLKIQPDFFTINDYYKPIQEVYLTHRTLDEHYSSIFQGAIPNEWLKLTLDSILRRVQGQTGPPASFPLHYWQVGWPDLFLLTAREKPLRPE